MSQAPSDVGRPRRAWVPVLIIIVIVVLAIAGALALRSRWLSREPRAASPVATDPGTRDA